MEITKAVMPNWVEKQFNFFKVNFFDYNYMESYYFMAIYNYHCLIDTLKGLYLVIHVKFTEIKS